MDLDHLLTYYRAGILFNFRKLLMATTSKDNVGMPQRNFFHNIFFFLLASTIALAINFSAGLVFSLAYLCHLVLDSLDNSNYFPFYPNLKINLRGPIKYFSQQEFIFTLVLLIIFLII